MQRYQISAMALVDGDGKYGDQMCACDVRGVGALDESEVFSLLDHSAAVFISRVRADDAVVCAKTPSRHVDAAVTLTPAATFGDLVRTLAECGAHRAFILDDGRRPVGVASARDVLRVAFGVKSPVGLSGKGHGR